MTTQATISLKKLEKFLSPKQYEAFLAWLEANKYTYTKWDNFIPTDKEIRAYLSWVAGKMSINEVDKVFGVSRNTTYTRLAFIGAYIAKGKK